MIDKQCKYARNPQADKISKYIMDHSKGRMFSLISGQKIRHWEKYLVFLSWLFCNIIYITKWHKWWEYKTTECCMVQPSVRLACEQMLPNPVKPAGPTFPCTAPGIVKGAALSLRARGWITVHGGSGRAVTLLRASFSPWYLPNLQRTVSQCWCAFPNYSLKTKQTNTAKTLRARILRLLMPHA